MRNNVMTGPILLSTEDSAQIRQKIFNPSDEYIKGRDAYFDGLAAGMVIHAEGSDSIVEFSDLDLSNLDAIIDGDLIVEHSKALQSNAKCVFTTAEVSLVNTHSQDALLRKALFLNVTFDATNTRYTYDRAEEKTEIQGCNLAEAA